MACLRYYGFVPRDAGRWVGCWGRRSPLPRMQPMHACMQLTRGSQSPYNEAQPRMLDVSRAWDARGAPSGRCCDHLPTHKSPKGRPYEPTAQAATHIVNSVHGVRCQWRAAALRGKGHSRHPKRGGCPSAFRPCAAHTRLRLPTPAHVPLPLLRFGLLAAVARVCMPYADHTDHWKKLFFVIMRFFFEGVTPFISPVRSACAPLTAHPRTQNGLGFKAKTQNGLGFKSKDTKRSRLYVKNTKRSRLQVKRHKTVST
jgi:hypothetical protein